MHNNEKIVTYKNKIYTERNISWYTKFYKITLTKIIPIKNIHEVWFMLLKNIFKNSNKRNILFCFYIQITHLPDNYSKNLFSVMYISVTNCWKLKISSTLFFLVAKLEYKINICFF